MAYSEWGFIATGKIEMSWVKNVVTIKKDSYALMLERDNME